MICKYIHNVMYFCVTLIPWPVEIISIGIVKRENKDEYLQKPAELLLRVSQNNIRSAHTHTHIHSYVADANCIFEGVAMGLSELSIRQCKQQNKLTVGKSVM